MSLTSGRVVAAHRQPTPPFSNQFQICRRAVNITLASFQYLLVLPPTFTFVFDHWLLDLYLDMASSSAPTTTALSAASPVPMDSSASRSCTKCHRRMSSLKYDQHTICAQCRDVVCNMTTRCAECSTWFNKTMTDYLKHEKSLATKSKKKPVTSASSASSSLLRQLLHPALC